MPLERPIPTQDEAASDSGGDRQGWWKWLVALASFGLFLGVLWYAYNSGTGSDGGPIRTVTSDEQPFKVRPEDPGGQKIPDQDKLVFGEAVGRPSETPETLARPPEEPMERKLPPRPEPKPAEDVEPAKPPAASKPPETLQAPKEVAEPSPPPEPVEDTPKAAPKAEPAPVAVASAGGFRVQIGSFQDRAAADAAWARIAPKHQAVISGTQKHIKQADLGAKGTWYRLQFGPYATRAEADSACGKLKAAGQDCLVDGS